MIILVTGVPGSGKTLYAVHLLQEYQQNNEFLLKTQQPPRDLYADIDGLQLENVARSPEDWRNVPDGSVVIYDECQQRFGPDGAGRSSRPEIQELETHRHRGIDIILITQHPKLLHAHVRRLVGRHYHLFRMYGAETAKVFRRDGAMDVDRASNLRAEDSFLWQYPKKLYGNYKSATVHTHKRQLPAFVKRALWGLAVVIPLIGLMFWFAGGFFRGDLLAGSEETAEVREDSGFTFDPMPANDDQEHAANGRQARTACIWNEDRCICYDQERWRIEETDYACQTGAAGPPDRLPEYRRAPSAPRTHVTGAGTRSGSERPSPGPVALEELRL